MSRETGATLAYAGGQPLPARVAEQASRWYVLFLSGADTDDDRRAWLRWRQENPDHERAWAHLSRADERMRALAGGPAYEALSALPRKPGRRNFLGLIGAAAGTGLLVWQADHRLWLPWSPDMATASGERRDMTLADGTRVLLNTDTAISLTLSPQARRIVLHRGELSVQTGHAKGQTLPLAVETRFGLVTPLGTHFTVRQTKTDSQVGLISGQVEISLLHSPERLLLQAGQYTQFDQHHIAPPRALSQADTAWQQGELVANDMALGDFLQELARYRPGLVSCDPAIAHLRLSGLFPLDDTDKVLQAVTHLLPVQVSRHTRYWVRVSPRS